jgi:glycosyltransferase involved in cell wall biosynthesis
MRLLYLTPTAAMGGAERVLLDLLGMLRREQPSWALGLIAGSPGHLADEAANLGVATTVLPFPRDFAQLGDFGLGASAAQSWPATLAAGWVRFARHAVAGSVSTIQYVKQLKRSIAEFHPDVVHSNGIKMHLLGALSKPAGSTLLWHFHDYPSARPVTNRLIKALKHRCDGVIAVSNSVAADLRRELGSGVPVHTIWNSVDLARFSPAGSMLDLDALAGLPPVDDSVPRIGLVATFARWKGHKLFLEMLGSLKATHRFRGYIVGGPLYETHASQVSLEELRATIRSLQLSDCVGLTGFVGDTAAALRSLDIVVHASTAPEPFGLVIAEAMAAGRAVVISDGGGVAELVRHSETGSTYEAGSVEAMRARVRDLLEDEALRNRLGGAAHEAALRQFHPDRVTQEVLGLYARFANRRTAA